MNTHNHSILNHNHSHSIHSRENVYVLDKCGNKYRFENMTGECIHTHKIGFGHGKWNLVEEDK